MQLQETCRREHLVAVVVVVEPQYNNHFELEGVRYSEKFGSEFRYFPTGNMNYNNEIHVL